MRHFKKCCAGLGVLLLLGGPAGCGRQEKPVRLSETKPSAQKAAPQAAALQQDIDSLLKAITEKNPFRQDQAVGLVVKGSTDNSLKGIVWDSENPYAIIGERVVRVGDYIGAKKVAGIQPGSVTLESAGQQEILYLD